MTNPFKDWIKEKIPEARIDGNVICIESDDCIYTCSCCGGNFKSRLDPEEDADVLERELICDVCFNNQAD